MSVSGGQGRRNWDRYGEYIYLSDGRRVIRGPKAEVACTVMAEYRLERLSDRNADVWEEFNDHSMEGSAFHSLWWKELVEGTSPTEMHYFLQYRDDEIHALFPFKQHSIGPFGGLVPPTDPQCLPVILADGLDSRALRCAVEDLRKVTIGGTTLSFIVLSTMHSGVFDGLAHYRLLPWSHYGDMVLDLSEFPPERIWHSFRQTGGQRKYIRRFDKDGFAVTEARTLDDLRLFYTYYEANIRHIGATPWPFSRFAWLCDSKADDVRITLLSKGPLVAGGLLQLLDRPRKTVYSLYLSLNRALPGYHPTYYLHWEAVTWAWEHGYEKVSFGVQRPDDENPRYLIKKSFGAQFTPWHSRLIPLTRPFSVVARWRSRRSLHHSTSHPAAVSSTGPPVE